VSRGAGAAAGGGPGAAALAERVCATRGRPSRAGPPCGQLLVGTGVSPRGGAPPPALAGERAACGLDRRGQRARAVVGLRAVVAWRARACGRALGLPGGRPAPRASVVGTARVCARPNAQGGARRKLQSVRPASPGEAASVRGQSNQAWQLHLAGEGGRRGRGAVAAR
jgi:hypothetical protein